MFLRRTEAEGSGRRRDRSHHFHTGKNLWGHLKKALLSYRRKMKAHGEAKHDQDCLSSRTKIFLYVKILSTFADSQPSLFTTLINKKDMLPGAIYSNFKPRNSQLAPQNL
jgi:hypothetical protein